MQDLTSNKAQLLAEVKSFLNITWEDTDTDERIWQFILSSIRRIDEISGYELSYTDIEPSENDDQSEVDNLYLSMCYLAKDLLNARVYYLNEKALDDFEKNYQSELTSLFLLGKVYASEIQD